MDLTVQSIVVGIVQGLTEFLPVSSSGHLVIVPFLLGWNDPFLNSLPFSVMLHMGTLAALLAYFWRDWLRLVPAGLVTIRDRSFRDEPDRRLAWQLAVATIPAALAGLLLEQVIEERFRTIGLVTLALVVGAAILWFAERAGRRTRTLDGLGFAGALGIGVAQAVALVPGISRSGISISAGLLAGLEREAAARFSFLLATPISIGAGLFEVGQLLTGEAGVAVEVVPLAAGVVAAAISGLLAIHGLLRFLRSRSTHVFVAYRIALAAVVVVVLLGR